MTDERREIRIGAALIVIDSDYVETRFDDGTACCAAPEDTDGYRETARDLGYEDDTGRLCVAHELAHSILAEARGLAYSPVLWAVAHDQPGTPDQWAEEDAVMALQAYSNGGPRPDGDGDWDAMRDRLLEVTR